MKNRGNTPSLVDRTQLLISPAPFLLESKTEILFGITSPVRLLNWGLAYIGSLYSITDRTVSNEMVNYCSLVGLLH